MKLSAMYFRLEKCFRCISSIHDFHIFGFHHFLQLLTGNERQGFVMDFVYKIPGVFKEFSRTRNGVFKESLEDFYAIH